MKQQRKIKRSLFSFKAYILYFILVAFVVTCCMILFLSDLDKEHIDFTKNAFSTFLNVLLLRLIITLLHGLYYKITVEKPVRSILNATQKIVKGDFSVRIDSDQFVKNSNELDIIINNFNEMAKELSGIETLRLDFISNVSHELKTPLAIIRNYSELMMEDEISNDQMKDYARNINNASRNLSDLITNILKLNRLENQSIYLDVKQFNMSEQLTQAILGFENIWEEKEIEIDVDIEDDILIESDEELWMIVWNNLLSNAFKFTDPHGKVSVHAKQDDRHIRVTIQDNGCGMSKEVGKHIFDKFYQGDTSHATQGNGLGLALVKRIIDIVQASISVESTLGEGTAFSVVLEKENK